MSAEILKVIQEMRERKVNHGRDTSPALEAWADRLEAALSQQADPVCRFCGKPSGDCDQSFPHPSEPAPAQDEREAPIFGDEDHVSIPRGLIGAACSAIDKKRDAPRLLAELRRYTFGDLFRPAQTEQQRPTAYPHEAMDKLAADRYRVGAAGAGTLHGFAVRAGDGEQELYRGSKSDCEHVARKLAGAFLDGGFTAFELYAAPIAQTAPSEVENLKAQLVHAQQDKTATLMLLELDRRKTAPPQDEQEEDQHDNSTR